MGEEHQLLFQRTEVQSSAPSQTAVTPVALLALRVPGMYVVHIHTCRQNTHIQEIITVIRMKNKKVQEA